MMKTTLKTMVAAAVVATGLGGVAQASSVTGFVNQFAASGDGRPTVFEDTTFSWINPDFADGIEVGEEIFAAFNIQEVGVGGDSGFLDTSNFLSAGPPASVGTQDADVTIEGILKGDITSIIGSLASVGDTATITVTTALAEVYFKDAFEASPVTTRAATESAFTDGDLAATFDLTGVGDFFTLEAEVFTGGVVALTGFQLAMTNTSNLLFPGIVPGALTPFNGGGTTDLFASGDIPFPTNIEGSTFAVGDANFAINLVPSPAGFVAGLAMLGLMGMGRISRRRVSVFE